jgi:hypothetical protein
MSDYFERIETHLLDAVERNARPPRWLGHTRGFLRPTRFSRRAALATGGLVSAAVLAAVVLTLSASTSPPAYAVIVHRDGTVSLTLNELVGVGPANERMAELGVRARLVRTEHGCTDTAKPIPFTQARGRTTRATQLKRVEATLRVLQQMLHPAKSGHPSGVRMWIRPDAIPHGETLVLAFHRVPTVKHKGVAVGIVDVGGSVGLYRDPAPTCLPSR